jgi:hypothetical protein
VTGEEREQKVLELLEHEPAPFDALGSLRLSAHPLCLWTPERARADWRKDHPESLPPGLCPWQKSHTIQPGTLLWSRGRKGNARPERIPEFTPEVGSGPLYNLTTELKDYWVSGDGKTFFLAHNLKTLTNL